MTIISSTTDPMAGIYALWSELKAVEGIASAYISLKITATLTVTVDAININTVMPLNIRKKPEKTYSKEFIKTPVYTEFDEAIAEFISKQDAAEIKKNYIQSSQVECDLRKIISKHPHIILTEVLPEIYWAQGSERKITIDIFGTYRDKPFALEYDGGYWHRLNENFDRDSRKSKILLRQGYKVLRVREAPLKLLPMDHPNFYQFHFLYDKDHMQQNFAILLPQIYTMLEK
jgi:hypothetical protein